MPHQLKIWTTLRASVSSWRLSASDLYFTMFQVTKPLAIVYPTVALRVSRQITGDEIDRAREDGEQIIIELADNMEDDEERSHQVTEEYGQVLTPMLPDKPIGLGEVVETLAMCEEENIIG
jgi:hypothetical protein